MVMIIRINHCSSNHNSTGREIRVMISDHIPYAINQQKDGLFKPQGLDITILNHFAKIHGLKLKYIKANESLSYVFSSAETIQYFLKSINEL